MRICLVLSLKRFMKALSYNLKLEQRKNKVITQSSFARSVKTSPNKFHQVTSFKRLYVLKKIGHNFFGKETDFSYKYMKHYYEHKQEK